MSALGTKPDGGMTTKEGGTSRTQSTAVGSGSRPGAASVPIKTTAPSNPHTMDRNPPSDWLK